MSREYQYEGANELQAEAGEPRNDRLGTIPFDVSGIQETLMGAMPHFKGTDHLSKDTSNYWAQFARTDRRGTHNEVAMAVQKATLLAAGIYLDRPRDSRLQRELQQLISPKLNFGNGDTAVADIWAEDVMRLLESKELLDAAARDSILYTESQTSNDDGYRKRLGLLRYLDSPEGSIIAEEDEDSLSLPETLSLLCNYYEESEGIQSPVSRAIDDLRVGLMNSVLAQDMALRAAMNDGTGAAETRRLRDIRNLVNLVEVCTPEVPSEAVIDRLSSPAAIQYWPSEAQYALAAERIRLTNTLTIQVASGREYLREAGYIIRSSTPEDFERAIQYAGEVKLRKSSGSHPYTKAEIMAARAAAKKARKQRDVGQIALGTVQPNEPEVSQKEVRPLVYLDEQGNQILPGEQAFEDMKARYTNRHPGDAKLADATTRALDYLQSVDFSAGVVRGIKKYSGKVVRGGIECDIYGFKPQDAAGLQQSSQQARKMRILFTFLDGNVAVLDIMDRDEVVRWERNKGAGGAAAK